VPKSLETQIGVHSSFIVGLALAACCTLIALPVHAHFVLQAPAAWMSQDASGNPQKLGPCGDEGGGTATGKVTAYQPGQTVTITINEVVFHPGHYRVALSSTSRSELPSEPPVTAASTPCGSVPIQSPPVFPVLADGVLAHTAAFSGPQSIQITLPANVTCTKCTLQVIEFMSNHPLNNPGGCFYHHCADISIQPAGAGTGGAAGSGGAVATGGSMALGGSPTTGGAIGIGGSMAMGGMRGSGGAVGVGGSMAMGGSPTTGGAVGTGGASSGNAQPTSGAPMTPIAGGVTGTASGSGAGGLPSTGGQSVAGAATNPSTNGSCSCSILSRERSGAGLVLSLLLGLCGLRKRGHALNSRRTHG
jgi:hypothetical protein